MIIFFIMLKAADWDVMSPTAAAGFGRPWEPGFPPRDADWRFPEVALL